MTDGPRELRVTIHELQITNCKLRMTQGGMTNFEFRMPDGNWNDEWRFTHRSLVETSDTAHFAKYADIAQELATDLAFMWGKTSVRLCGLYGDAYSLKPALI